MDRRGSLILGIVGFAVTAVVAIVAILAYTANSGQDEQIQDQSVKVTRSLCASANTTASAFREPAAGETEQHFVERLLAQRKTLRYSFGLGCSNLKGFEDFPRKRREALADIDRKLATLFDVELGHFPLAQAFRHSGDSESGSGGDDGGGGSGGGTGNPGGGGVGGETEDPP